MWDEVLFLFNYVYYGSIRGNYCYFCGYCFGVVWCGAFFLFVFLQNNTHSSNKLFLEDFATYKNYQLLLIC